MRPREMLAKFDEYLSIKGLHFDAVVIGGAALALLGVITRETQDCDVLDPSIPQDIADAARDFSHAVSKKGGDLKEDWLNNGPESLKRELPKDWKLRLKELYSGKALNLQTLGRADLLKTKLFAFCDRGQDLADCVALKPSQEELREALAWLQAQDANPGWSTHVESQMKKLSKRLAHGA